MKKLYSNYQIGGKIFEAQSIYLRLLADGLEVIV